MILSMGSPGRRRGDNMQNPLNTIAPHHAAQLNLIMCEYVVLGDGERCHAVMVDYLKRYDILDGYTISCEAFAENSMKYFLHTLFSEG